MTLKLALIVLFPVCPVIAQTATVRIVNVSRPAARDFQVGDRYTIEIVGGSGQPISVRTTATGRTDWSPIIAYTDTTGRWSTSGRFERGDFGSLREVWTVGGKAAAPVIQMLIAAPCLPGGKFMAFNMGLSMEVICETSEGTLSFVTPSNTDPLRTPDGRLIDQGGRPEMLESFITSPLRNPGYLLHLRDKVGAGLAEIVGDNALTAEEIRNVLSTIHDAFSKPEQGPPARTRPFLEKLANQTDDKALKDQIAETIADIQR